MPRLGFVSFFLLVTVIPLIQPLSIRPHTIITQPILPSSSYYSYFPIIRPSHTRHYTSSTDILEQESEPSQPLTSLSKSTTNEKKNEKYKWSSKTIGIALPALIGAITDPLLSLIDTAFVGQLKYSKIKLASLGACTSIFHLAFNAFRSTTAATTTLVSESLTKSKNNNNSDCDDDETRRVTAASIQFGLLSGIILIISLLSSSNFLLSCMGINKQLPSISTITKSADTSLLLHKSASSYFNIRALSAPFVLFCTVAEGIFRGYANTTIPLYASLLAASVNLVMDPLLMFSFSFPVVRNIGANLGISGAAAATSLSQCFAAFLYLFFLIKKRMVILPNISKIFNRQSNNNPKKKKNNVLNKSTRQIWNTILKANLTMMLKQGSLLLAWSYATAKATRIGLSHVAAHQVALSLWLIFALIQDGVAVSGQVLMSQIYYSSNDDDSDNNNDTPPPIETDDNNTSTPALEHHNPKNLSIYQKIIKRIDPQQLSLTKYMIRLALVQGCTATIILFLMSKIPFLFSIFTNDPSVKNHLIELMPILAIQQPLIGMTLMLEGIGVGGSQFSTLATGTTMSTMLSMFLLNRATNIKNIWSVGIVCLFTGRLITAAIAVLKILLKEKKTRVEKVIK